MFSTNLKYLRRKFGYDQQQFGEFVNRGISTISEWENGKYTPKAKVLTKITEIFNVSLDELLNSNLSIESNENKIDFFPIYNSLSNMRKQKVYEFATQQLAEQNNVINIADYKTTEIAVYGAVSAGRGEYLGTTNPEMVTIEGTAPEHDYAVRVNGDSMEPLFQNGQFIFVRKVDGDDEVRSNQIVVATFNGDAYVKKFIADPINNKCKLVSLNPEYADIEIHEYDEFDIIGIVVL